MPLLVVCLLLEEKLGSGLWLGQWLALGPILVEVMERAWDLNKAMAVGVLAGMALQSSLLGIWALEEGVAPWTLLTRNLEEAFRQTLSLHSPEALSPANLAEMEALASRLVRVLVALIPGIFASVILLLHWWNLLVGRRFPCLWGGVAPGPDKLDQWGMPYTWVWVTIAGGILALLPIEALAVVGANLLVIMSSIHFLQGIAVMASVFRQRAVPRPLRAVIYALVFLQQVFLLAVMVIGLFDVWFDFRKRWGTPTLRA